MLSRLVGAAAGPVPPARQRLTAPMSHARPWCGADLAALRVARRPYSSEHGQASAEGDLLGHAGVPNHGQAMVRDGPHNVRGGEVADVGGEALNTGLTDTEDLLVAIQRQRSSLHLRSEALRRLAACKIDEAITQVCLLADAWRGGQVEEVHGGLQAQRDQHLEKHFLSVLLRDVLHHHGHTLVRPRQQLLQRPGPPRPRR
mmetsp:Transcript_42731/g.93243  ORF Transcript_42731/g.93243 Transcript_42731/m.93243 type:complete len:201 (+) Transcript_42731:455-1057(+)